MEALAVNRFLAIDVGVVFNYREAVSWKHLPCYTHGFLRGRRNMYFSTSTSLALVTTPTSPRRSLRDFLLVEIVKPRRVFESLKARGTPSRAATGTSGNKAERRMV
jgi:hypothetical protein